MRSTRMMLVFKLLIPCSLGPAPNGVSHASQEALRAEMAEEGEAGAR